MAGADPIACRLLLLQVYPVILGRRKEVAYTGTRARGRCRCRQFRSVLFYPILLPVLSVRSSPVTSSINAASDLTLSRDCQTITVCVYWPPPLFLVVGLPSNVHLNLRRRSRDLA
ncbi:hypothetical protein QBC36DRAFT_42479 [Triangularia setosa]|uniref:Uncharacterized protein n=1 Tax=Triangularia setosa TaxID=2587417 RepID=A0AAN6W6B5_9PEZI|nr:hypothetical protein QBC36DRAFT_42479 [Podospora setosa]